MTTPTVDVCRTACGMPCVPCAVKMAEGMSCDVHPGGRVHYRAVYGSFECHTYRDRQLMTHVVAHA